MVNRVLLVDSGGIVVECSDFIEGFRLCSRLTGSPSSVARLAQFRILWEIYLEKQVFYREFLVDFRNDTKQHDEFSISKSCLVLFHHVRSV